MPRALITGITGQDGPYLRDLLLKVGYDVQGTTRGDATAAFDPSLHTVGLSTKEDWKKILTELQPDEIYHFAADSFIPNSWEKPIENIEANLVATTALLEAVRDVCPKAKLINACSREVFGNQVRKTVTEESAMTPTTPYGVNKAAARWMCQTYRERYGLFVASAILFNHESPRRSPSFVTRKISKGVAAIATGQADSLQLGALSTQRDWGYAPEYVDAMWRMTQIDTPEDFIIATGQLSTIGEFAENAFATAGLCHKEYVRVDHQFDRAGDVATVQADISKAKSLLDWQPTVTAQELARIMTKHDLQEAGWQE